MNPSDALREALEEIRELVRKRQLPITNQVWEIADAALAAPVSVADVIEGEVERVARYGYAKFRTVVHPTWDNLTPELQAWWLSDARAALRSQVVGGK